MINVIFTDGHKYAPKDEHMKGFSAINGWHYELREVITGYG